MTKTKQRTIGGIVNNIFDCDIDTGEVRLHYNSDEGEQSILLTELIEQQIEEAEDRGVKVTGETSDGYHSFNELYEHRYLLFANLIMNLTKQGFNTWKSKKHSDGSSYEGWFIAGINWDKGEQISYHLPLEYWDLIHVRLDNYAPDFDGHTSDDVLKRLKSALGSSKA